MGTVLFLLFVALLVLYARRKIRNFYRRHVTGGAGRY